jgi:hypothetical protein
VQLKEFFTKVPSIYDKNHKLYLNKIYKNHTEMLKLYHFLKSKRLWNNEWMYLYFIESKNYFLNNYIILYR